MTTETIDLTTVDGVADAYLAIPDGAGPYPGVLLLMDAFGLRPQIEKMSERIAANGFVVLAPNVFYRAGRSPIVPVDGLDDPERRDQVIGRIMPLMAELTTERITSDASAYLDQLQREADGKPVAITGYCMGGRLGWNIAAAYPHRVAALGCFHTGGLVSEGPESTHLRAAEINADLYLGFADHDQNMTRKQITTVERTLNDAGVTYRSEVYKDALHGYTMADTPAYDEAAAERHYTELFALLDRTVAS